LALAALLVLEETRLFDDVALRRPDFFAEVLAVEAFADDRFLCFGVWPVGATAAVAASVAESATTEIRRIFSLRTFARK
jgi:hypothetical protein